MEFKRYKHSRIQNYLDSELTKCPFCNERTHWQVHIKRGLWSNATGLCEKCGAKINFSTLGGLKNANVVIKNVGPQNIHTLKVNDVYHFRDLRNLAISGGSMKIWGVDLERKSSLNHIFGTLFNVLGAFLLFAFVILLFFSVAEWLPYISLAGGIIFTILGTVLNIAGSQANKLLKRRAKNYTDFDSEKILEVNSYTRLLVNYTYHKWLLTGDRGDGKTYAWEDVLRVHTNKNLYNRNGQAYCDDLSITIDMFRYSITLNFLSIETKMNTAEYLNAYSRLQQVENFFDFLLKSNKYK